MTERYKAAELAQKQKNDELKKIINKPFEN